MQGRCELYMARRHRRMNIKRQEDRVEGEKDEMGDNVENLEAYLNDFNQEHVLGHRTHPERPP